MQNSQFKTKSDFIGFLKEKALWARKETLNLHRISPGSRIASCLSDIEIFTTLYYGGILKFDSKNTNWEERDRFVISKGHGAVSLYPILADLGFFDKSELAKMSKPDSFLCDIPDTRIPGFETINGALGHGLGVAAGIAIALKNKPHNNNTNKTEFLPKFNPLLSNTTGELSSYFSYLQQSTKHQPQENKNSDPEVFVLMGDGELYEGAVWESIMFASHHKLDNLTLIIDNNKTSMLGRCKDIVNLGPLEEKFRAFKWKVESVDGHNLEELYDLLTNFKENKDNYPKAIIANTIKGKGVPSLENDPLSHIRMLKEDEIIKITESLE